MNHHWCSPLGLIVLTLIGTLVQAAEQPVKPAGYFPALEDREAWRRLPRADKGTGTPLPTWARVLARSLPGTTAAMLELDHLHRARSPLEAGLRGKMRWMAARANRCAYSEACAIADLERAGLDAKAIDVLRHAREKLPVKERKALTFASKMMTEAHRIRDEEVADLISVHGEKAVVAMVLMLAHASFQDRVLLSLGLGEDLGGPLPSLAVEFPLTREARSHVTVPVRKFPDPAPPAEKWRADRDWLALDHDKLRQCLVEQKERRSRIRVPTPEELSKILVPGATRRGPSKVIWSSVTGGYQPVLAGGWGKVTSSFREEARQDPVFSNSVFWVVTRSLQCFY